MKQFIEFIPVLLFVVVYFTTRDIYISTGVLMAGICFQVAYEFIRFRKVEKKTTVIFWVAMLFGGATLAFRNQEFIQWKPTIVNWLFCVALLMSQLISGDNLIKKMLSEQLTLPDLVWRNLALGWSLGFFLAGGLNLVIAYNFSLDFWVTYKLVGGIAISLIYMIVTMVYLIKGGYIQDDPPPVPEAE
ncbi:MAG: septation protein [Gammaproteobacteria bacterium]|nr:septation protein [Gammaproteobacteria bacterium]